VLTTRLIGCTGLLRDLGSGGVFDCPGLRQGGEREKAAGVGTSDCSVLPTARQQSRIECGRKGIDFLCEPQSATGCGIGFQMRKCKLTRCVALLLVVACWAQDEKPFAVLPPSEAQAVNRLCSRTGPGRVDGGWAPEASDVATLEAQLGDVAKVESSGGVRATISNPFGSYRQYVGIVVGGKRLIYVNAFAPDLVPKDWKTRLVNVCDGGPAFWGVIFDPMAGKFFDLKTNGVG